MERGARGEARAGPANARRPRRWRIASPGHTGRAPRVAPDALSHALWLGLAAALTVLVMFWRAGQDLPTGLWDSYPLYYGAKAWLQGDAYALERVAPLADRAYSVYRYGNPYPLPAVLLFVPLTLLAPKAAAVVWLGGLTAGLVLALRLNRFHPAFLLYWPVLNGLRLEQYTLLIVVLQLLALWAYRRERHWVLAACCAVILTKPNHGLLFVVALLALASFRAAAPWRLWWRQALALAVVWGGATLLDPRWVTSWLAALADYRALTGHQPFYWGLALLAVPLLLVRDYLGGAIVLQFALLPWPVPVGTYPASALPLSVLDDRRSAWLTPLSFLWPGAYLAFGPFWAAALTLFLPVVALALLRARERRRAAPETTEVIRPAGQPG